MTITLDLTGESTVQTPLSNLSVKVARAKKIVVVTGAGISCSSGIPVCLFHRCCTLNDLTAYERTFVHRMASLRG